MSIKFNNTPLSLPKTSYLAGIYLALSVVMLATLFKEMIEYNQIASAIKLLFVFFPAILAMRYRNKWIAENSIHDERENSNKKLAEIERNLTIIKTERDELSLEKEALLADLDTAYVLREQQATRTPAEQITAGDRSHVTDNLAVLNQAAQKWWGNAAPDDRSTHPMKSDVVAWLMQRGFSQITAENGATIIKPEWAGIGRKPKE